MAAAANPRYTVGMGYAELRHVEGTTETGLKFEVFSEPWGTSYTGPSDRNWDDFTAGEDSASYTWRGGPDILGDYANGVVEGSVTIAQVAKDERVSWWFQYILDNCAGQVGLDDEDTSQLSSEDICRGILDSIRSGESDIDTYDGKCSYYFFEWDNYIGDAIVALELPEWAKRESFDGGGPGSSYSGWLVMLEPGKTLEDLETWLYDPSRRGNSKKGRRTGARARRK